MLPTRSPGIRRSSALARCRHPARRWATGSSSFLLTKGSIGGTAAFQVADRATKKRTICPHANDHLQAALGDPLGHLTIGWKVIFRPEPAGVDTGRVGYPEVEPERSGIGGALLAECGCMAGAPFTG
jgi:hypothetical protein